MASVDIAFIHAPAIFDFRQRAILYAPLASVSRRSPICEVYPPALTQIAEYLERTAFSTVLVNMAVQMLMRANLDPTRFLSQQTSKLFILDMESVSSVQGTLEVARILKTLHPRTPLLMFGNAVSVYRQELMERRHVDYVLSGDSIEEPLRLLAERIVLSEKVWSDIGDLDDIPNLSWKDSSGRIEHNPISWVPGNLEALAFDHAYLLKSMGRRQNVATLIPNRSWLSAPESPVVLCRGCNHNCICCPRSYTANYLYQGRRRSAWADPECLARDLTQSAHHFSGPLRLMGDIPQAGEVYTERLLKALGKGLNDPVELELYTPPDDAERLFKLFDRAFSNWSLRLSAVSHDEQLRADYGKPYSNQQLTAAIRSALATGCRNIELRFLNGIPQQTRESILQTTEWLRGLREQLGCDARLRPSVRVMAPFLPAGSIAADNPESFGYRLRATKLDDLSRRLLLPSWKYALNYESESLSADDLVESDYRLRIDLNRLEAELGVLDEDAAQTANIRLHTALEQSRRLDEIIRQHRGASPQVARERAAAVNALKEELDELSDLKVPGTARKALSAASSADERFNPLQGTAKRLGQGFEVLKWQIGSGIGGLRSGTPARSDLNHPRQQHDPAYLSPRQ
ncbi:MAG: hypothetical protein FWF71_07280 [Actinomycetia bacterium]|nr:hypothetical protein [Actinomycetes bacterium]